MLAFDTLFSCQGAQCPARTAVLLRASHVITRLLAREGIGDNCRRCGSGLWQRPIPKASFKPAFGRRSSAGDEAYEPTLADLDYDITDSAHIEALVVGSLAVDTHRTLADEAPCFGAG